METKIKSELKVKQRRLDYKTKMKLYTMIKSREYNDYQLADMFGISSMPVYYHRRNLGVEGQRRGRRTYKWTEERLKELGDYFEKYRDNKKVAEKYGISLKTLYSIVYKARLRGIKVPYLFEKSIKL